MIKFVSGCDQHPGLRGPVTSPTCLQRGLAKMAEMTNKIEEESTFYKWLKSASLDKHYRRLSENGITEIYHLEDVKEDDAESLGPRGMGVLPYITYMVMCRFLGQFSKYKPPEGLYSEGRFKGGFFALPVWGG